MVFALTDETYSVLTTLPTRTPARTLGAVAVWAALLSYALACAFLPQYAFVLFIALSVATALLWRPFTPEVTA